METIPKLGFIGATLAVLTTACCVLPMAFMLVGLGGSWLAIFGKISAFSIPVAVGSVVFLALAWGLAIRNHGPSRTYKILSAGTVLSGFAFVVFFKSAAINSYLITLM